MTRKTTVGVVHFAPGKDGVAKEDKKVTQANHVCFDGLMSEADQDRVTGISRVTRWRLEREGKFPARIQISPGRVARHGHEIKNGFNRYPA